MVIQNVKKSSFAVLLMPVLGLSNAEPMLLRISGLCGTWRRSLVPSAIL